MFLMKIEQVIRIAVRLFAVADLRMLTLFYPREAYRFVTDHRAREKLRPWVAPHAACERHSISFKRLTPASHKPVGVNLMRLSEIRSGPFRTYLQGCECRSGDHFPSAE